MPEAEKEETVSLMEVELFEASGNHHVAAGFVPAQNPPPFVITHGARYFIHRPLLDRRDRDGLIAISVYTEVSAVEFLVPKTSKTKDDYRHDSR